MTIDVYKRYYEAQCVWADVERRAAVVTLTAESGGGDIRYFFSVSFFPHRDAEDFAVSYDAYAEREIYASHGRRSKKREEAYLSMMEQEVNALAETLNGTVFWDKPLGAEMRG